MNPKLKRAGSFLLIPLSAVPFVAAVPLVAPSVDRRFEPRQERPAAQVRPQPPRPQAPELAKRERGVKR